jgi:hypothetical protein
MGFGASAVRLVNRCGRGSEAGGLGVLGRARHRLTWVAVILALLVMIVLELGMDQVLTRPSTGAASVVVAQIQVGIAVRPARKLLP